MCARITTGWKATAIHLLMVASLAGCGGEEEAPAAVSTTAASAGQSSSGSTNGSPGTDTAPTVDNPGGNNSPSTTTDNRAPVLSGTPSQSVKVGDSYVLQPQASDPDGDAIAFTIANKPAWMSFNTTTGKLSGTPQAIHVGTYANIRITASDGEKSASLAEFSIAVTQISTGTVTLSWMPPVANTDGSTLTNLAGYRIHYGTSADALDQKIDIDNASVSRYVVENLSPATWYFAVRSVNAAGVESSSSGVASKKIG